MREYNTGKHIDPENRLIARTTDADFFLVIDKAAPPETRYKIRSRGNVRLTLSGADPDTIINDLRQWSRNHARCLLTFYCHQVNR